MSGHYGFSALKIKDIQLFIGATAFFTLASRALAVVIGFQIYKITHSPLSLGWLGLVEAVPAISLVLIGGWVADHHSRRRILLITRTASLVCALTLALLSLKSTQANLLGLYSVIFLAGIARAFADPASTAFEAQVVPQHLTVNAASWISSSWISCSVIGPAVIGFVFDVTGAWGCYLLIALWFLLSWGCTFLIAPKPQPVISHQEPMTQSITLGWKFVFGHQALTAALALDLFAVLFGGMIALLPVFAQDILHVGARGLGLLNAAPSLGALIVMLYATRHPPIERAGRNLLLTRAADAVFIGCGRIGTLNEFTIAFEDHKPIGVLEGEWETDEVIRTIIEKGHRPNPKIVFDKDPKTLVEKIIALVEKDKSREHRVYKNYDGFGGGGPDAIL